MVYLYLACVRVRKHRTLCCSEVPQRWPALISEPQMAARLSQTGGLETT